MVDVVRSVILCVTPMECEKKILRFELTRCSVLSGLVVVSRLIFTETTTGTEQVSGRDAGLEHHTAVSLIYNRIWSCCNARVTYGACPHVSRQKISSQLVPQDVQRAEQYQSSVCVVDHDDEFHAGILFETVLHLMYSLDLVFLRIEIRFYGPPYEVLSCSRICKITAVMLRRMQASSHWRYAINVIAIEWAGIEKLICDKGNLSLNFFFRAIHNGTTNDKGEMQEIDKKQMKKDSKCKYLKNVT
ncbi:hypothetical protein Tco_1022720, partial [Tanacetum coccineum]